jgi:hypothetical protein
MASKKEQNARMLDPNRFKIAQSNAVMPGGPQNNNPMNITDFSSPAVEADSIYGDHRQSYAQMGVAMVNPMMVPPTMQRPRQEMPQPSPNAQEPMEGMRMAQDASNRGLLANSFLGLTGSPALVPGALDPSMPGSGMPLMPPSVTVDQPANSKQKGKK